MNASRGSFRLRWILTMPAQSSGRHWRSCLRTRRCWRACGSGVVRPRRPVRPRKPVRLMPISFRPLLRFINNRRRQLTRLVERLLILLIELVADAPVEILGQDAADFERVLVQLLVGHAHLASFGFTLILARSWSAVPTSRSPSGVR